MATPFRGRFDDTPDRVWLGPEWWANPMEDWRVADGRIECLSNGGNRNVHVLTRQLGPKRGRFEMSVRGGLIETAAQTSVGFRIGIRDSVNDYRGNCIFGKGFDAGIGDGTLRLGDVSQRLEQPVPMDDLHLHLQGKPSDGGRYTLTLTLKDASNRLLGTLTSDAVAADDLVGNVALVNNFSPRAKKGSRFWFASCTTSLMARPRISSRVGR